MRPQHSVNFSFRLSGVVTPKNDCYPGNWRTCFVHLHIFNRKKNIRAALSPVISEESMPDLHTRTTSSHKTALHFNGRVFLPAAHKQGDQSSGETFWSEGIS
jgi:hypothetical protein